MEWEQPTLPETKSSPPENWSSQKETSNHPFSVAKMLVPIRVNYKLHGNTSTRSEKHRPTLDATRLKRAWKRNVKSDEKSRIL